ncbi:hypothetical protein L1049_011172 [Liquidambar formosana]|uniref:Uncharacterized protein n=1 Tax=Liquidambar formosana TaxID=63359 RepID=A0AAP0RUX3_LIQFO
MSLFEAVMPRTGEVSAFSKGNPNGELQQCSNQIDPIEELQQSSNQITAKPRKRAREFSWQRHRKRRQLNFQEANFLTPCTRIHTDKGSLSGGLQGGSNTRLSHHHEKVPQQCSCCLRLQAFGKSPKGLKLTGNPCFISWNILHQFFQEIMY